MRFSGYILVFSVLFTLSFTAYSQTAAITGIVTDASFNPMIGATVAVMNPVDSSLITGISADINGSFQIVNLVPGNYLVKISFVGYDDLYKQVTLTMQTLVMTNLVMAEGSRDLKEVVVEGKIPPAVQKGDTTQFNASAFKTNPDANAEDLVTKMPGVSIQDGKVQAQGEEVQSVLVDGKPFFGEDPSTVLKNIPAEFIDKIQVFDKRSDQSLFTGFDDGNTSKTINIVTRPQFRNGTFGKVFAGYGDDERYKSGFTINLFKDKRRVTILGISNNINEQNFSMEDLAGISSRGSSGRSGGSRGGPGGRPGGNRQPGGQGGDAGNFLVGQSNGINETHALGLNYSNQWNKLEATFSYFFNYTGNKSTSNLLRQYNIPGSEGQGYSENKLSRSNNINHRANLKLEYKLDTLRSVLFQPRFSAQVNNGFSELSGSTFIEQAALSSAQNYTSSQLYSINFSAPILLRNGFRKKGRTISLNLTPGYNSTDAESFLNSGTFGFIDSLDVDSVNQMSELDRRGFTMNTNLSYTEPVIKDIQSTLSYQSNYNNNTSDKQTFDKQPSAEDYNLPNIALTNKYRYEYFSQSVSGGLRYQKEKINLSVGVAYQIATAAGKQYVPYELSNRYRYFSILPNAMLNYKFSEKKNLRIQYRTRNNPPAIEQLQDVVDNTNPLQVTTGNPQLKQDYSHNMNVRYSSANSEKNNSFFMMVNFGFTQDYIGTSTYFITDSQTVINGYPIQQGAQVTQPFNFDQAWSARSFINYSFTLTALKSNLNLNAGMGYSKNPGLLNNRLNYTAISTPGFGLSLTSNISTRFDFTVASFTSFTFSENSVQAESNSRYLNQMSRVKLNVMPWKVLVFQTEITHQYYTGLSENFDDKFFLWNAGIGYKFLKNKAAELRLSVYDILDENKSIVRNTTETYYEDVRSNVLQRYFMLTFTYNLRLFKDASDKKPGGE